MGRRVKEKREEAEAKGDAVGRGKERLRRKEREGRRRM